MRLLAELCESVSRTGRKTEKVALVAKFFQDNAVDDSARACIFLSGRAFPAYEETTLTVGGALLSRVLIEMTGATEHQLSIAYRRHGDLGSAAFDLFTEKHLKGGAPPLSRSDRVGKPITLEELETKFRAIAAASGPAAKGAIVRDLLQRATPLEAKYLVKFMGGDLRIGLRESLVEEAVAKAYNETYDQVRRANMLLGDIGGALRLAAGHRLSEARMRLFYPIGMMLATPVQNSAEAFGFFSDAEMQIEDKYDGIRAQVHIGPGAEPDGTTGVRIFSRTMDDITESFPELAESLRAFPFRIPVILDGEILAWDDGAGGAPVALEQGMSEVGNEEVDAPVSEGRPTFAKLTWETQNKGRALPFSRLQQRLGRKSPTINLMREVPVAFIAFDVLFANEDLVIEGPLRERALILDQLFIHPAAQRYLFFAKPSISKKSPARSSTQQHLFAAKIEEQTAADSVPLPPIIRAPVFHAETPGELDALFDAAQARGNEGLMIKDLNSPYTPGRRGKSWLKLKRELATLDVVVTAVEYGYGKRAAVLSDYTFAVRDSESEALLNVGKAYSGLTDVEIAELTLWFKEHTIEDFGHRRLVEPKIVLEVAFNNVMQSDRHDSGYALRFPRILRLRPDKPVSEIDSLDRVREIYQHQHSGMRQLKRA